jgi:hypothetical protein
MGGVSQMAKAITTKTTQSATIASFPEEVLGFWRR